MIVYFFFGFYNCVYVYVLSWPACLPACLPSSALSLSFTFFPLTVCLSLHLSLWFSCALSPYPPLSALPFISSLFLYSTSPTHPSIQQSIHWWQTLQNTLQHTATHTVTLCNTDCHMLQYTSPSIQQSIHLFTHPCMSETRRWPAQANMSVVYECLCIKMPVYTHEHDHRLWMLIGCT